MSQYEWHTKQTCQPCSRFCSWQPHVFIQMRFQALSQILPVPLVLCFSQVSVLQGNQQTQNACDSWQQTTFDSTVKQTTDKWLSCHNCKENKTLMHQHILNIKGNPMVKYSSIVSLQWYVLDLEFVKLFKTQKHHDQTRLPWLLCFMPTGV